MSITFRCEHCGKDVQAPDAAAGKRGKCPFCGQSNYIPAPVAEEDLLPLAPVDEEEERKRAQEIRRLRDQDRELIAETGGQPDVPLEHRKDMTPEDLYHLVVNYCLDLANSNLERARTHVAKLRQFRLMAQQAVNDFLAGKASEQALSRIPPRVLQGFLARLRDELK